VFFQLTAKEFDMKAISFLLYFFKLHMSIMLGLYHTSHPLDMNWRWRFWQQRNQAQRGRFRS